MGRYLSTNLWSASVIKTDCKVRYLLSLLRKHLPLGGAPVCMDLWRNSLHSPPHPSRFTRKPYFRRFNHSYINTTSYLLGDFTKEEKHLQSVRFYSSPKRNTFKAEAPIGIFEEAQTRFNLSSLGGHLGRSFNRLSRHINVYFKRKEVVPQAETAYHVATHPVYVGRSQRRSQSQHSAREREISESKDGIQSLKSKDKTEGSGGSPSSQGHVGLQLFHISSLATAFGESYNYVANHINSVFSRHLAKAPMQETLETMSSAGVAHRRKRRKKTQSEESQVKSGADQAVVEANSVSSSWEEGYLHFARHINKYFGARVTDEADEDQQRREQTSMEKNSTHIKHFSTKSASQTAGLFHSSHNTTNFGENHFHMAGHINEYFNGESGPDEDFDRTEVDSGSATSEKTVSFMDILRHPTSAIPDLLGAYLKLGPLTQTSKTKPVTASAGAVFVKKLVLSQRRAEEMTRGLIGGLAEASSPESLTACVEALNEHLNSYPSCKAIMWQEKTAATLLRKRRTHRENQSLQRALRETLALIGYMDPVKGRGIRVLAIDGGGTRGVVPLQVLKLLEAQTGQKIHHLFDYICGVSTGAVLAFMLGLNHLSLEECADMYRRFGSEVFRQNPLVGTVKMGWSHSYYNTETWETILQEKLGHKVLIKTARDELSPKVSAVSAVVNWGTSPKAFVFRNYNHKPGSLSRYAGVSGCQMWQAVRASSAAPGYFQEFPLLSDVHQDGGILLNNPCALAVHESRLLWPNQPFQCVLSLGTGRYDNAKRAPVTSTSLRAKISSLISSATDTEGVHTLLDDLLPPDVYFRFNPMLSALVSLDESRPRAMDQLQRDTQNYLDRNRPKLARLCLVLGAERSAVSRTKDWMSERAWVMKQRWG